MFYLPLSGQLEVVITAGNESGRPTILSPATSGGWSTGEWGFGMGWCLCWDFHVDVMEELLESVIFDWDERKRVYPRHSMWTAGDYATRSLLRAELSEERLSNNVTSLDSTHAQINSPKDRRDAVHHEPRWSGWPLMSSTFCWLSKLLAQC